MFISELRKGDRIEYQRKLERIKYKIYSGIVVQATENHVTVDLGNYKDSFLVNDVGISIKIISPAVEIPPKGNKPVRVKPDISMLTTAEVTAKWEEVNHRIDPICAWLGTSWNRGKEILAQHGLINLNHDEEEKPYTGPWPAMEYSKINWKIMWPLVREAFKEGLNRREVCDRYNIPLNNLECKMHHVRKGGEEIIEQNQLREKVGNGL